jgi:ParB family chromosome partitioning protein
MGAKERKAAHGDDVKIRDLPHRDPEALVLVTDEKSHLYDSRVLDPPDEDMVRNIQVYGPAEPVIVEKNTETGKYEVIDGRGRVKACREANKRIRKAGGEPWLMPFIVKRLDSGTAAGLMISLNEIRREDSPLNRARKAARMLEHGKTEADVALAFGTSESTIKNLVKLLDAPAAVRNAVESGKITASDGYKLAKLEPEQARAKVQQIVAHAPRVPGKKRASGTAAKKTREIIDGPRAGQRKSRAAGAGTATGAASTDGALRAENVVENVLRELQALDLTEAGGGSLTKGALVALQWVLGDDAALKVLGL